MRFYEIREAILDRDQAEQNTQHYDEYKEVVSLLKTHCSDAWDSLGRGHVIAKGFGSGTFSTKKYMMMNVANIERKSENTANAYTVFMSKVSDSWKRFPPRNRSLICATDISIARGYGTMFYVFPFNGTKIGVCPADDLWGSFATTGVKDLSSFSEMITDGCTAWLEAEKGIEITFGQSPSDDQYIEFFNQPVNWVAKSKWKGVYNSTDVPKYEKAGWTVGQFMEEKLNPKTNGFELMGSNQLEAMPFQKEAWFSGKCILVRGDLINQ